MRMTTLQRRWRPECLRYNSVAELVGYLKQVDVVDLSLEE